MMRSGRSGGEDPRLMLEEGEEEVESEEPQQLLLHHLPLVNNLHITKRSGCRELLDKILNYDLKYWKVLHQEGGMNFSGR